MSLTSVQDIGEFGLIERIQKNTRLKHISSEIGIGDDAAGVSFSDDNIMLLSTDMLVNHVHFDLMFHPLKHLGYKSVVVSLSDIAAMNAIPTHITVAIAVSSQFSVEAIDAIYSGIHAACENYQVDLVGGNTTSSNQGLVITTTAWGTAKKTEVAKRTGARKNDVLCVSGDLGGAFIGLQLLLREKKVFLKHKPQEANFFKPQFEDKEYVLQRYLKPEARVDLVKELAQVGVKPTAMIDISDGLSSEIQHICKASKVGVRIYEERLPIDDSAFSTAKEEFQISPLTCVLNGGEDYELLFTVSLSDFEKIKNSPNITSIGYITEEPDLEIITYSGKTASLKAEGWKHF